MFEKFKKVFSTSDSKTAPNTKTKGHSGTPVMNGYIQENELNQSLLGKTKYVTYGNILANTAIVAAGTRYFLNLVAKPTWSVQPADDSSAANDSAQLITDMMGDMDTPWYRVIRRAAMYRFYGFSLQEWTAKRSDSGHISILDICPRPQATIERWDVDLSGRVAGVVQRSPSTFEEIYLPISKLIYVVDDTLNDSPEGLGLFRHIVEPVARLQRYEQLEGFGFESDLRGIPVGRGPFAELQALVDSGELSPADKAAAEQPLVDFMTNHIKNPKLGLLLDSLTYESEGDNPTPSQVKQWDLQLLSSNTTSQEPIARAIERLNQEIARVLGVEGLLLGGTSNGSQALSTDKSNNFALIIDSTLKELKESFEKEFIDVIWKLNGFDKKLKPSFKIDQIQFQDITKITEALRDLALAGAPMDPNDPAINEVRDLLGLSKSIPFDETDLALTNNPDPHGNNDGVL